jgi:hypothetical protein
MTNYWVLSNKFSITNTYLLKLYIAHENGKFSCSARVKRKNHHPLSWINDMIMLYN